MTDESRALAVKNELVDVLGDVSRNPVLSSLVALALNQALYKAGAWNPRATGAGQTPKEFQFISIDSGGVSILRETSVDPEEIASRTASTIAAFIMAAGLVYAAKSPVVQPILGVGR